MVVMCVDQLCQDYLVRFRSELRENDCFLTAQRTGVAYINCHHQHAFTFTGPGHATLATGTYPNRHGIIGNSWYSPELGKTVRSIDDADATIIGSATLTQGASSKRLLAPTLGDTLKLSTGKKAKVYSVGLKDRAACLTAGRLADGVFWYDYAGNWVTSDCFASELPGYIRVLNEGRAADVYSERKWTLLYDAARYQHDRQDANPFENPGYGLTPNFPHVMPNHQEPNYYKQLVATPWGNDYTLRTAREIIRGAALGQDAIPDLLHINLAANDYVGHHFGPHSLEVEDIFYRTDRQLGEFIRYLDQQVGTGRWTIALSSDHGVSPIATYMASLGWPAQKDPLGNLPAFREHLNTLLASEFKDQGLEVAYVESNQVFLKPHADPAVAARARTAIRNHLTAIPAVTFANTREQLLNSGGRGDRLQRMLHRAFHSERSGDVLYVLAPYHHTPGSYSTTHGSPWQYDTHVPLMLFGSGVRQVGKRSRQTSPAALAPTLAAILQIPAPAMAAEAPLFEAIK
ncbi:MAG TPA: hypothetical protein DCY79_18590 [Planctomycetaceae bacterium]|nr:hypothetical protein [Planctomycetaceae bacterium]